MSAEPLLAPDAERSEELTLLGLSEAHRWLDRHVLEQELGAPDAGQGACDECGATVLARWTLGDFRLCRSCRRRRAGAGDIAARAIDRAFAVEGLPELSAVPDEAWRAKWVNR